LLEASIAFPAPAGNRRYAMKSHESATSCRAVAHLSCLSAPGAAPYALHFCAHLRPMSINPYLTGCGRILPVARPYGGIGTPAARVHAGMARGPE